jgi:hypothetical protein
MHRRSWHRTMTKPKKNRESTRKGRLDEAEEVGYKRPGWGHPIMVLLYIVVGLAMLGAWALWRRLV